MNLNTAPTETTIDEIADGIDRISTPLQAPTTGGRGRTPREVDPAKLEAFLGKVLGELGASASALLVRIGDELGLYRAMADGEPVTPGELASRTGTAERYVREWLANQAAGGYVEYDPRTGTFTLPPEQALALATEDSPASVGGAFQSMCAFAAARPRIAERFRSGDGLAWGEHHHDLFAGTERFFRPGYAAHLVAEWIPALDGVEEKLERGAKIADVGCGHGVSTVLLAKAYPRCRIVGYDTHAASIESARRSAERAGVADRVTFEEANAVSFPGEGFDLVAHFDSLHDMADPVGAARQVRKALAPGGTWMLVEPFAGDRLEENLNPVGRLFYAASTLVCVPNSLAGHGLALGAQAGETRLREVVEQAGFGSFRRATQTPFNLVLEAR
jgi:SAM-dependent methyltransferase